MIRVIRSPRCLGVCLVMLVTSVTEVSGQTTAFTYQGQLTDAGAPANGNYDLRFGLFDAAMGGAPVGTAQTVPAVPVSNGIFTVQLDFGAGAFPGANRFLEIEVRPIGGSGFTTIAVRQQLNATPYAIQARNAQQLDGVLASQYVKSISSGQVGIGTVTPQAKLEVSGSWNGEHGQLTLSGHRPTIRFTGDADSGNQSWLLHLGDDGPLGFYRRTGIASYENVMSMAPTGNIHIGTGGVDRATRLFVGGGPLWTSAGWRGSLGLDNATAIGWDANSSGQRFAIGQSSGGLYFFRTNSAFGSMANPANYDMVISDSGNIGIGTITPTSAKLHADGGGAYGGVHATTGGSNVPGVYGGSSGLDGTGVIGEANNGSLAYGVWGKSTNGHGVHASSQGGYAVYTDGRVHVGGPLEVTEHLTVAFSGFFDGHVFAKGFENNCDRNVKANFSAVEPRTILHKLAALPVQTWNFRNEDESVRHVGPVAQDFHAAFELGHDDTHISTVDANGVALAAIQGLYQIVQEKDGEIARLEAQSAKQHGEIADLKERLAALEQAVHNQHARTAR